MTLVLRKLLASSTFASAATLRKLADRLAEEGAAANAGLLDDDFDVLDELADEWEGGDGFPAGGEERAAAERARLTAAELGALREYAQLAESISTNAKGEALLGVLRTALDQAEELGVPRKAVIFTESRRTQQ